MASVTIEQTLNNIVVTWVKRFLDILVVVITVPIITRHFGLELIGIWLLATQLTQHIYLLELGINVSLTRFLSRYRAKNNLNLASQYLSTSILFLISIGLLIIIVSPIIALIFQTIFSLPPTMNKEIFWLVLITTCITGLNLSFRTGVGMLSSIHKFDTLAFWETMALLVRLILVCLCFYWFDPNFLVLALITYIPPLISNLIIFLTGKKLNHDLSISKKLISKQVIKDMTSVGGSALVITLAALIARQSSSILVGWELGYEQVASLTFPVMVVFAIMPFISIGATLLSPVASQLDAENKYESLYAIYSLIGNYVFLLALIILLGFYYMGFYIFDFWLSGPKIEVNSIFDISRNTIIIFSGVAIAVPGFILRQILIAVGNHWKVAISEVIGAIIGILIGYFLMTSFELGTSGMAIGISLAFIIRGAILITFQAARYFSVSYFKLLFDCITKPLFILISSIVLSEILLSFLNINNYILINILSFVTILTCMLIGFWIFLLHQDHKQMIFQFFKKRLKHFRAY